MRYAIVEIKSGTVITDYPGDVAPSAVQWPNGDTTHAVSVGDERAGHRLVAVEYGPAAPGEFYDIAKVTPELNGNVLLRRWTWVPQELETVKNVLIARVDEHAERERLKYITPGAGQAMVYLQKLVEAKAAQADGNPDPARYPLLDASVAAGEDLSETAAKIVALGDNWTATAASIERKRLEVKASLAKAATVDGAVSIFEALKWD